MTRVLPAVACLALALGPFSGSLHSRSPVPGGERATLVLVGDSTVTDEAGWGLGLKQLVGTRVEVVNAAAGGRSSKSYMDEGRWKDALARKGQYYLIQFGHNDQPGKGPARETDPASTYPHYLGRYVDEARAIGATPILITSLTRRHYGPDGRIQSTLTPYVDAVKKLAAARQVPVIELHERSIALAERMGEAAWPEYSPRMETGVVDRTHLNAKGSLLIARLVLDDLRRLVPALSDAVVAADGSGQYRTVQEAINAVPQNTTAAHGWVIFVRAGTYHEIVYVQREKRFVTLAGEDAARTIITHELHANMIGLDGRPIGTFRTPTVQIDADDFHAENLTFQNAAGPVGQALALRVDGDRVSFRNCRFLGWQDTIFLDRGRHTFEDSYIEGHVDFIFGGATAFFDRCHIHCLRNGYITAASTPREQPQGFVFRNSRITGVPGVRTYLGRPWRDFAQVTLIDTEMSEVVRPEGWHNWDRPEREKTVRYFETGSRGPGAQAAARVSWARPGPGPVGPNIVLWPEGVPGRKADAGPERIVNGRVTNVHDPSLTYFPALPGLATGAALIVCPGGGYVHLAIEKEGEDIARRLNAMGVAAFVLKYRLAEYGHPAPLQDVLRAIRLVRSRAAEFGVIANRVGVFGASAGGHLAASAATLSGAPEGRTGAALDAVSARPDFVALLYPVITMMPPHAHAGSRRALLGRDPAPGLAARLSLDRRVTKDTPPVFLVHSAEDASVPVDNSLLLYAALRRAGVPVEMHLFEKGAHGFGLAENLGPTSEWPRRLEQWLESRVLSGS